jgi:hypothetical protein
VTKVLTPERLYRFHVANLRAVTAGLDDVHSAARALIARGRMESIPTQVRLCAFLLGAWSESRLLKLLYEPNAFSEAERVGVLAKKALDRWHAVLQVAYRRHYRIPRAKLAPPALPVTAAERYRTLRSVLDDDLSAVITLRNKLAHGQWQYPLNDTLSGVAQAAMDQLRTENLLTLRFKSALVDSMCQCIHDVVVSRATYERDFDSHFNHIEQVRVNLKTRDYARWVQSLQSNFERGQVEYRRRVLAGL